MVNAVRKWMARDVVGIPAPTLAGWAYKPVIAYFARIKLYAIAHSHPAVAARLMLEHKRIEHQLPQVGPDRGVVCVRDLLDRVDALIGEGVMGGRRSRDQ